MSSDDLEVENQLLRDELDEKERLLRLVLSALDDDQIGDVRRALDDADTQLSEFQRQ